MLPEEVAERLRIPLARLLVWAKNHRIPVQYVNRQLRFLPSQLDVWLQRQRQRELRREWGEKTLLDAWRNDDRQRDGASLEASAIQHPQSDPEGAP